MDWFNISNVPIACYPVVVHNIQHVGKCAAELVQRIRDVADDVEIHVIGFSLGAQVSNYIANNLEPYKLDRISGIDPAFPFFVTSDKRHKLDPSDAYFVDVLHCNASVIFYSKYLNFIILIINSI